VDHQGQHPLFLRVGHAPALTLAECGKLSDVIEATVRKDFLDGAVLLGQFEPESAINGQGGLCGNSHSKPKNAVLNAVVTMSRPPSGLFFCGLSRLRRVS